MTDQNPDRWTTRDYPILIGAADRIDRTMSQPFMPHELARDLGREPDEVVRALLNLIPTYLHGRDEADFDGPNVIVTGLTDEGRRESGLWPKRGDHLASLAAAIEAAAEQTEDAQERGALRRIGDGLAAAPGNVAAGVLTAWLASQGGI